MAVAATHDALVQLGKESGERESMEASTLGDSTTLGIRVNVIEL